MYRFICSISLAAAAIVGGAFSAPAGARRPCWSPPVVGAVADAFREPPCRWCAGNRGVEYAVGDRADVRAAASGTITFSGSVAGVTYLVVELPSGWRHTYGRLTATDLRAGDTVLRGTLIASVSGRFFFGLRIGDDYADPAPFLGELVGRPRLVPIDASPPRPAPPTSLRCGLAGEPGDRRDPRVT